MLCNAPVGAAMTVGASVLPQCGGPWEGCGRWEGCLLIVGNLCCAVQTTTGMMTAAAA